MENNTIVINKEWDFTECFTATMNLRWIYKDVEVTFTVTKNKRALQQMWQGSLGTQKWEDVKTITLETD